MVSRLAVVLVVQVSFMTTAAAQTSPWTVTQDPLAKPLSVVPPHPAPAWLWADPAERPLARRGTPAGFSGSQEVEPGWREGRAAADDKSVGGRKFLGFVGGLTLVLFGPEAMLQDNEPGFFAAAALGGAALSGLSVLAVGVGSLEPDAVVMEDIRTQGLDYTRAFQNGYSSRLRSRRARAGLVGSGLGLVAGAALVVVLVTAWCAAGDC